MLLMFNQGKVYVNGLVTWTLCPGQTSRNKTSSFCPILLIFDDGETILKRLNPYFSNLKTFLRCSKKDYTYLKPISCQSYIKSQGKHSIN